MLTGGCLCGAIRFEIEGSISSIWLCHCSKCRRVTGSAFHPTALCHARDFRFACGEDQIASHRTASGYTTRFCRNCGSPVPAQLEGTDSLTLSLGTLDQDPGKRVVHHIFTASKAPWYEICDDLPQYAEHKPGTQTPRR